MYCNLLFHTCICILLIVQLKFDNVFPRFQMGRKQPSENLDKAIDHMYRKTKDLRRQLRKAVVDHVSDRWVYFYIYLFGYFYH